MIFQCWSRLQDANILEDICLDKHLSFKDFNLSFIYIFLICMDIGKK